MNKTERGVFMLSKFALFIVFFWFGLLKVITTSPANPLVSALLLKTLPFITFDTFIILLGLAEMLIGLLFLLPKTEKWACVLLIPHMITTVMPLVLLPAIAWTSPFVPTLEGQYMIKNIVIIALAANVYLSSRK